MIKFFRQIRETMLNQNNTKRYLLYAIGEIVLVVIGILIALQINNWNEDTKRDIREKESLIQLHDEAEQIVSAIKSDMMIMEEFIQASKSTAASLKAGRIFKNDTAYFSKGLLGINFYPALPVPRNVYDEINGAGLFREISSANVRKAISKYYADLKFFESQLNYFRDVTLSSEDIYRNGFYAEFDEDAPMMRTYEVDFESLQRDKVFRTILSRGVRNLIVFQSNRDRLLKSAESMCIAIGEEIAKECNTTNISND